MDIQHWLEATVILSPSMATVLTGLVLPLLLAVVTKFHAAAWMKSLMHLILATAAGVVTLLTQAGVDGVPMKKLLSFVLVALVGSNMAYTMIWKPLGIWDFVHSITTKFGVGGGVEQPFNSGDIHIGPVGNLGESNLAIGKASPDTPMVVIGQDGQVYPLGPPLGPKE